MTTLKVYLGEVVIVCIPAVIIFLCFQPYRMKALAAMKLKSTRQREIALILFVIAIFGILSLTLWPPFIWEDSPGMWGHLRILIERPTWKSNLSLVPFSVFKNYLENLFKGPLFFFILFRKATWKRSAIIGFLMSLFIEFVQYFIMRNTAVDDIILNTAGAICGYFLYLIIRKIFPQFTNSFLCQEEV